MEAYVWTALAAAQDLPSAVEKSKARRAMLNARQIDEAERRIGAFRPRSTPDN